mmetsp:Transcript_44160/g.73283  ORF Transcript_44160/g.73283 Transcript_44160/m.73283 type:complete len:235 (+) Transcript_44160:22-726(+)|eukprot:CAMPEP_0119314574 /NCGR_PEP_ID=MMETSP1333-20130426/33203_1 /TAXON_ID=418940 /ORGANISM="Scyphosphaera apsteinii, Strain RCC1455" /LENGTH=234 /DNA_ID=CAMNT_0007319711 /DNA_START=22 /DNA_END=726 /DNA_ORIENTATION=+
MTALETALRWTTEKVGPSIAVDEHGLILSRDAAGWGAQLADTWLSSSENDHANVTLHCEVLGAAFIGVVGSNYFQGSWDEPLGDSVHAAVVDSCEGRLHQKRDKGTLRLLPLTNGARLRLDIAMKKQQMTIEMLRDDPTRDDSDPPLVTVLVEHLPPQVTLAVCFGPGKQRVRIERSLVEQTGASGNASKLHKDLWDDDNKVTLADADLDKAKNPVASARDKARNYEAQVAAFA